MKEQCDVYTLQNFRKKIKFQVMLDHGQIAHELHLQTLDISKFRMGRKVFVLSYIAG